MISSCRARLVEDRILPNREDYVRQTVRSRISKIRQGKSVLSVAAVQRPQQRKHRTVLKNLEDLPLGRKTGRARSGGQPHVTDSAQSSVAGGRKAGVRAEEA